MNLWTHPRPPDAAERPIVDMLRLLVLEKEGPAKDNVIRGMQERIGDAKRFEELLNLAGGGSQLHRCRGRGRDDTKPGASGPRREGAGR